MAASSADIRSILSLPAPGNHGSNANPNANPNAGPSQRKPAKPQKPDGISRELYSLIGDHAPSLVAARAKPKLRQKPDLGRGKVRWEWRTFSNGARKDHLQLGHWEKVIDEQPSEYPFAKYNTSTNVYSYTTEEYEMLLKDEEWTKEETDYLFALVKEYDMRWYVIIDRYEFEGGLERALEDLKARYYSVCRKLIRARPWNGEEAAKNALINSYQFDKERERTRKMYVASLFARTPEQIAEEDALYLEIKRLEQTERRFAKEREEVMKTVAGIESGLNVHQPDEEAFAGLFIDPRKKRRVGEAESPGTPGGSSGPARRVVSAKQAAEDARNCITRTDTGNAAPSTKASHQLAHLRSTKFPYPKSNVAQKVNGLLTEAGLNPNRLVMPTQNTIQLLESVIEAATGLVETKKVMDRLEQDIRTQKKLLGIMTEEEADAEAAAAGGDGGAGTASGVTVEGGGDQQENASGTGDGMDVDREASVVILDAPDQQTQRQQQAGGHKRSLSISSVETSATGMTRASRNNKRMKKS